MPNKFHDNGTKIQAITLLSVGFNPKVVSSMLNISVPQLYRLREKAKSRGWSGQPNSPLLVEYVVDAPRSGRPRTRNLPEGAPQPTNIPVVEQGTTSTLEGTTLTTEQGSLFTLISTAVAVLSNPTRS